MRWPNVLFFYVLLLLLAYHTHGWSGTILGRVHGTFASAAPFPDIPEFPTPGFFLGAIYGAVRFVLLQVLIYASLFLLVLWQTYILEIKLAHRAALRLAGAVPKQEIRRSRPWRRARLAVESVLGIVGSLFLRGSRVVSVVPMEEGELMTAGESIPRAGVSRFPSADDVAAAAKNPVMAYILEKALERQLRLSRKQIDALKLYKEGAQELIEARRRYDELSKLEEQLRREAALGDLAHQRAVLSEELEIERLKEAKRRVGEAQRPQLPTSGREKRLREFLEELGDDRFWGEVREKFRGDPEAQLLLDRMEADRHKEEF